MLLIYIQICVPGNSGAGCRLSGAPGSGLKGCLCLGRQEDKYQHVIVVCVGGMHPNVRCDGVSPILQRQRISRHYYVCWTRMHDNAPDGDGDGDGRVEHQRGSDARFILWIDFFSDTKKGFLKLYQAEGIHEEDYGKLSVKRAKNAMWDASSIINLSGRGERQTDGPGDYYIVITRRGGQGDLIKETDRAFGC
ncbi:hypothetical protein KQX54_015301 [Cotesia glomerata]|uniref:Uncharacterized protein n=1 Tax=Cotesia glomerata TaxID=32391 RepID=A0AAV7IX19_COTGL|nr:hypothetical protein KQX54_015301 [Cotesia glomerata]